MSLDARVTAKFIGETALAALLLVFATFAAWSPLPSWLKLLVFIPTIGAPTFLVVAAALRYLQGGATDVEIVDGQRRFSATGIRFTDLADAIRQGLSWHRRLPMARPAGRVLGNPADPTAVQEDVTAALPETVDTAPLPLEVPPEAVSLERKATGTAPDGERTANVP